MHHKGASDFYLDCFYDFLNSFDLVNLSCATHQSAVKAQEVDRSNIQFLSIFGVLLPKMCY